MMNLTRLYYISLLVWGANICVAHNAYVQSSYYKIAQQNLKSFTWEDRDWSDDYNEYLHQCLDDLQYGQPFQKRAQVFDLLGRLRARTAQKDSSIIDPITWNDLQLFYDNDDNNKYLGVIVDRAITELGKVQLLYMLGNPVEDVSVLQQRQEIVKELIANEALFKEVGRLLKFLHRHENKIFSFWYKRDPFWQAAYRCYWRLPALNYLNNSLNSSWHMLELKNRFDHYARICVLMANIMAAGVLTTYGTYGVLKADAPEVLKKLNEQFGGAGGELGPIIALARFLVKSPQCYGAFNILAGIYCTLGIKEQVEWERDLLFLDTCLQAKLIGIRTYLDAASRLVTIIMQNPLLSKQLTSVRDLYDFFHRKSDLQQQKIVSLFQSSTFKGTPSIIASKGKVVEVYKLLHEHKNILLPLFIGLAEIDAYYAIARLYKEFASQRVIYSFAQYSHEVTPYLILEDFWNPFVDEQKVVPNSLVLGGAHRPNGIVTGPNTGGKSCNLKAVALCLILGQSFGIVPARKATFTPFSKIMTHLNITDNIVAGNSLFKSEVLRAQTILNTIKQCKEHEFCFVIMDELFNGTTPREGQAAAYGYAKFIGSYPNTIAFIATHFAQLTELARITDYFQNYLVSVKYNSHGEIIPTFKLEQGISQQHIAFDILRAEGMDQEILDDAQIVLATTKKLLQKDSE